MLTITIPGVEVWDEAKQEFGSTKSQMLCLEHSLVSISKWESVWHKPFIGQTKRTVEETVSYIKCMTTTQNVDPKAYMMLTKDNLEDVSKYIDDSMTATWFVERKDIGTPPKNKEQVTSELIYYWMIALEIPFECQRWHLNRLLTLIRICNIKNNAGQKKGKKNPREILSQNAAINAARRKELGTTG